MERTKQDKPTDWVKVNLGGIVNIKYGKGLPTKKLTETGYPVFGANGLIGFYSDYLYENEQVLISCRGAYSGKIIWSPEKCYITNNSLILETSQGKSFKKYLFYALQSADKSKIVTGSAQPQVTINNAVELIIPLAPPNEQKRIVAEIEKQFSRLDEAVENLKRVKATLKRYKASVLKAAVEGKLTEEWRKKHPDVEPADKLLERILTERRKKWEEAELAKMKAKGKEPKDDKWKKKYQEPSKPSKEDLKQLPITNMPGSWILCTADQLTSIVTDGEHITPKRSDEGMFLLSARNIQDGWISFDKVDYILKEVHEKIKQRLTINEGDVLLSCSGSVGRSCVAPKKPEFSLVRSVAVLKPVIENGEYMSYSIRSSLLQSQIDTKKTQTAQANIFQGKIRTLIFTLPPLQEQDEIIIPIQEKLSIADNFESVVDVTLKRADRLHQSILKKAFSGQLIPSANGYESGITHEMSMAAEAGAPYGTKT